MIKGGHAIMLGVVVELKVIEEKNEWIRSHPGRYDTGYDHHVTIAFLGRDKDERIGAAMLKMIETRSLLDCAPRRLYISQFGMFGREKDVMAGRIYKSNDLMFFRTLIAQELRHRHDIDIGDEAFEPHVSLAYTTELGDQPPFGSKNFIVNVCSLQAKIGDYTYSSEI